MMPDRTNAMFLGLNNWEDGRGEGREQKDKGTVYSGIRKNTVVFIMFVMHTSFDDFIFPIFYIFIFFVYFRNESSPSANYEH